MSRARAHGLQRSTEVEIISLAKLYQAGYLMESAETAQHGHDRLSEWQLMDIGERYRHQIGPLHGAHLAARPYTPTRRIIEIHKHLDNGVIIMGQGNRLQYIEYIFFVANIATQHCYNDTSRIEHLVMPCNGIL